MLSASWDKSLSFTTLVPMNDRPEGVPRRVPASSGGELPLVSIVTPTWNRASLLAKTIASVRAQMYTNIEHIVVDGDSTDGTKALLAGLESKYPLRWVSEPDDGMYAAINKGLKMAKGGIVAYLNSDDLYFPWTLDVVVDAFQAHPAADFIYGDALSVDDLSGRQAPYWMLPPNADYIKRVGFFAQPSVFWGRSAMTTSVRSMKRSATPLTATTGCAPSIRTHS